MSEVEDYPGPTNNHPEKMGHNGAAKADQNVVTPIAGREEASRKNLSERQSQSRQMKRSVPMKVVRVDTDSSSNPYILLQCPEGEKIGPKATITTKAIFPEQETLVESADSVKVLGKGKPGVGLGDVVDVPIV
ncbi:MAG: hypothetical protein JO232_10910 [Verrucomicrobia bacterium]|nr:hypothetical protein [Verrucomicrobiota bacterium]